jgi:hypothetical protein
LAAVTVDSAPWALVGVTASWSFAGLAAFLIAGEPLGPSARVETRWAMRGAGRLRRWLGPGVVRAGATAALVALVTLAAGTLAGVALAKTRDQLRAALAFGAYAAAFSLFLIGFCVWMRSRSHTGAVPRVLGLGALFVALLGPYIALAIAGILADSGEHIPLFAAPSPAFAFVVVDRYHSPGGDAELYGLASATAAAGWALLGIGLFATGAVRARRRWLSDRARTAPLEPRRAQ